MRRLVLSAVVVVVAVLVGAASLRLGSADLSEARSDAAPNSAVSVAGSDRTPEALSPHEPGPEAAASAFVAAFLDTGQDRDVRLATTTSDRLGQLLARTDPAKIPTAVPVGLPEVLAATAGATTVRQRLSDGSSIAFDLVPDSNLHGWIVTSVRPGER